MSFVLTISRKYGSTVPPKPFLPDGNTSYSGPLNVQTFSGGNTASFYFIDRGLPLMCKLNTWSEAAGKPRLHRCASQNYR